MFSIIIPIYNVAPYLRECLDSVLAQTYTDWEVICVDDGSTDGSAEILDEVAIRDGRIRVIHKSNGGVSSARNRGLDEANGEWILFLDGDDVWHPELLATCAGMIEANPDAALVNFARIKFLQNEQPQWPIMGHHSSLYELRSGIRQRDMQYSFCTFCYRRELIKSSRFSGYVVGEDLLFRARALGLAQKIVTTDDALFAYRTRIGSASNSRMTFKKYCHRIGYLIEWFFVMSQSENPQPSGLRVRLLKDLIRAVFIFR